jgi:preprotein translocase subunit YajC
MVSVHCCLISEGVRAQESGKDAIDLPVVEAQELGKKGAEVVDDTSLGPKKATISKKNLSLVEEFFSSPLSYFLVLVFCLYVYLMFVQPRAARQEKRLQMERLNNLKKNDRVVTSAGIHGIVANINQEAKTVTLRVDENSNAKLTIDRDSIRSVAS